MANCTVCGQEDSNCGPKHTGGVGPFMGRRPAEANIGPLRRYYVTSPLGVRTIMKLTDYDAHQLNAVSVDAAEAADEHSRLCQELDEPVLTQEQWKQVPKKRGRPAGSKNKPKE